MLRSALRLLSLLALILCRSSVATPPSSGVGFRTRHSDRNHASTSRRTTMAGAGFAAPEPGQSQAALDAAGTHGSGRRITVPDCFGDTLAEIEAVFYTVTAESTRGVRRQHLHQQRYNKTASFVKEDISPSILFDLPTRTTARLTARYTFSVLTTIIIAVAIKPIDQSHDLASSDIHARNFQIASTLDLRDRRLVIYTDQRSARFGIGTQCSGRVATTATSATAELRPPSGPPLFGTVHELLEQSPFNYRALAPLVNLQN